MEPIITAPTASQGGAESELHAAAWAGDLPWAQALLVAGADVNFKDSIGEPALHGAAAWGQSAMVEFLLAQGADANVQEVTGLTPLHWAVSHGNLATVCALLHASADVNLKDRRDRTPLDLATAARKAEVRSVLAAYTQGNVDACLATQVPHSKP